MSATAINTHNGKNIEWTVYRNGHNELACALTLDGAPYDISAIPFTVYFRMPGKTPNKLTLTEGEDLTNGGADGILTIPLTEANIATLPADRYFILIEYTIGSEKYPLAQGYISIRSETNPGTTTDSVTIPVNISGVTVNMAVTMPPAGLASHIANVSNPHAVTKAQVGLSAVDNTADADKPVSTAQQAALDLKADASTLERAVTEEELLAEYNPVTSQNIISNTGGFSGWGFPIGSPQNIKSITFFVYPFDGAVMPTLMTVRFRTTDSNGAVLYEDADIAISPTLETKNSVTVTLSAELVNAADDELWFEFLTNGRVAFIGTAGGVGLTFTNPPYPKARYTGAGDPSGVTTNDVVTNNNCYFVISYVSSLYAQPTSTFIQTMSDEIKALDVSKILLPTNIYTLEGVETNLYFNQIVDSKTPKEFREFLLTGDKIGKIYEKFYRNDPTQTDDYDSVLELRSHGESEVEQSIAFKVAAADAGASVTRKLLTIGDSNTSSGTIITTLYDDLFATTGLKITTVGTLGTGNYLHEGVAGKTYTYFYADAASPFVFSGAFDFSQYLSTNGITMTADDWVLFHLGTNDLFGPDSPATLATKIASMKSDLDAMIADIQSAVPGIRICVCLPMPPADSQDAWAAVDLDTALSRINFYRNIREWWSEAITYYDTVAMRASDVYVLHTHAVIDTENNFPKSNEDANARNSTQVSRYNNSVHPSASGLNQVADCIRAFLKYYS